MNVEECKAQIKRHEGEVLEIYEDSLGYKTLGIGHLCQPQDPEYDWEVGTKVSQEVVDKYYEEDFKKHYIEAKHVFGINENWDELPERIQHVLVNMCFNLGGSRLAKFRKMLGCAKRHEWKEMALEMEDSKWFKQVGRRSVELQNMVLGV
jgi:GH24 family phage-related lysozyme (muramidase)